MGIDRLAWSARAELSPTEVGRQANWDVTADERGGVG